MNLIERKPQLLWVISSTKPAVPKVCTCTCMLYCTTYIHVHVHVHVLTTCRSKQFCLQLHTLWYHMMISVMYIYLLEVTKQQTCMSVISKLVT